MKAYLSEFIGTFGFVLIGWCSVVLARPFIGYLGVSMAFGMAYAAFCHAFPEGHFNPAATVAAALSGGFRSRNKLLTALNAAGYIVVQTAGACAAIALVQFVYAGKTGYVPQESVNIYLIDRYTLSAAFWLETTLNLLFLTVFLNASRAPAQKAAACGALITAAYLLSFPVTKGAMNPAFSTAKALFGDEEALSQLSLFWKASLTAAVITGAACNPAIGKLFGEKDEKDTGNEKDKE